MQKKEEVDLSYEKLKKKSKKIFAMVERVIYTGNSFSVTGGGTKYSRILTEAWGLLVGGPFTETMMNIYRLSIAFF